MKFKTQKTKYKGKGNPNYGNHKLAGKNHPFYGIKGKDHPAYKGNAYIKCIDCGKPKTYPDIRYPRCQSCATIYQYKTTGVPTWNRIKYKNIWMRSTWEVIFAKYMIHRKIKWQYEPKTFELGNTIYTPDFYLTETNTYVEIKGWWRDNAKKRFELFKKLYPNIKIKVLDKKKLLSMGILI